MSSKGECCLEAIAYAANTITVGSESVAMDETLAAVRDLADSFRLIWHKRIRKGFFLRAEGFFGYVERLAAMEAELERELLRVEREYGGRSPFAKSQARMAFQRELSNVQLQYGRNLNTYSHGESFLELFQSSLIAGGLYLLDEPEVPLSPSRQLTLISMLKQMVQQDCQFIIATHSPILMAFPGATILSMDETPLRPVDYETVEHVAVTRSFLNDPDQYLRHL
jgi:predicted ATPase